MSYMHKARLQPRWAALTLAVIVTLATTLLGQAPGTRALAIFKVNSDLDTPDATPGNGTCATAGAVCTLRAAIQEANALAGADVIEFDLGAGFPVIKPATELPPITQAVTINGNTGGATKAVLSGELLAPASYPWGLNFAAGPSSVSGMVIQNFGGTGIGIQPGAASTVTIAGNWIGTDTAGTGAAANVTGITILSSGHVVGGDAPAERNIISGNDYGVYINAMFDLSNDNRIIGNYIGTNASGTGVLANTFDGIFIVGGDSNDIGSGTTGEGNVISGNGGAGINIAGTLVATANVIRGNYIGTNAMGSAPIANSVGILLQSAADTTYVGGPGAARNVISGNTLEAIQIAGANTSQISGNYIGVQADGVTALGNGGYGIAIGDSATGSLIGNSTGNVIAHNGGGVLVDIGAGHTITNNSIYSNGGLGIELGIPAGVTPNDLGDGDTGANGLQNFPVISAVRTNGSSFASVDASLNSTPSTPFSVHFYASPSCDPSGYGEGQFAAPVSISVTTDASGNTGTFNVSAGILLPVGYAVTATATSNLASQSTSEFSACVTAVACSGGDPDCDGHTDTAPTAHQGPSNPSTAFDNCPGTHNPDQRNTDGNFIDNSGPYVPAVDDKTYTVSDALGDACDADADNDGLTNAVENSFPPCAAAAFETDPLKSDTDGDRVVDKAECDMGSDPNDALSKPAIPPVAQDPDHDALSTAFEISIGTNPNNNDTDGDKAQDGWEVKGYGSNPLVTDTDGDMAGDGARDSCEIGSINGDRIVNPGDQALLSSEIMRVPPPAKLANFDLNKDGAINVGDQAWQASMVGPGKCP